MTINELLSLAKAVRGRLSSLENLRDKLSVETDYMGSTEKVVKPQYDVKAVDKKITYIQTFLYKCDAAIKQSNAKTEITTIPVNVDELLSPIE